MDNRINAITKKYAKIINKQYKPKEIYLYGSYARGEEKRYSDIDIAVVIEPVDLSKYMDIFGKLFAYAIDVDGRIEPNLLIDDGEEDKYSFLYEVKRTGIKIEI